MKRKKTTQNCVAAEGVPSCDVQEASRCLKEYPYFHHELGDGDQEYAQEDRRSNMQVASGTFQKICDDHQAVFVMTIKLNL